MPHTTTWTEKDFSGEPSSVTIFNGPVTALTIAGYLTAIGTGRSVISAITRGTMHKEMWVGDNTVLSNVLPTDPNAQRELGWYVTYEGDTSHKKFHITLPCADPSLVDGDDVGILLPGTDIANLENEDMAAFVTWFNGFARSPDNDTESITILSVELVGRNK